MNTSTTNSVSVFSKTNSLSSQAFNNWFSGNTTNFGSKSFNNWFNGNTTNFGRKALQPSFDTKIINPNEHRLVRPI